VGACAGRSDGIWKFYFGI